jgi:zinc resistance-associated protein
MKKIMMILVVSVALTLTAGTLVFAQSGNMGPGGGMWNNYQTTPEQQKAFVAITEKYQPEFAKIADKMWAKRAQLNGILAQEKIDRKKVKSLAAEVGALLAQSYELQVEMLTDLREKGVSFYGMGMMHGGMMGGGMMDMMQGGMMGGMMNMMMGGGQYQQGGQYGPGNSGMMQGQGMMQ